MKYIFTLVLIFAIHSPRAGAADCSAQFRSDAKSLPIALIRRGYSSFGTLQMSQLLRHIDSIAVEPGGNQLDRGDLRSTARWSKVGGRLKVMVDCAWYGKFPRQSRSVLALHESLWSFGVFDRHYWVSMSALLLSESAVHKILRPGEIGELRKLIIEVASKSGGVVGVGGGGEIQTVECKAASISRDLVMIRDAKTEDVRNTGLSLLSMHLTEDLNCLSGHRLDSLR